MAFLTTERAATEEQCAREQQLRDGVRGGRQDGANLEGWAEFAPKIGEKIDGKMSGKVENMENV